MNIVSIMNGMLLYNEILDNLSVAVEFVLVRFSKFILLSYLNRAIMLIIYLTHNYDCLQLLYSLSVCYGLQGNITLGFCRLFTVLLHNAESYTITNLKRRNKIID